YQSHPVYAAMMANLDANIGRLLDALTESGRAENTLVIITSDNGGLSTAEGSPTSNAPLAEGKGWMQDGGVRVPFLVGWPGRLPAGATSELPFSSPDLYPTLLAAAGAPPRPEQHVDGVDLLPAWSGDDGAHGPLFWHYPHYSNQGGTPGAAVREGRWKLLRFFEDGRQELYDLEADPGEQRDVAADEPEMVARLGRLLDEWSADVVARVPERNLFERFEN
ncbi:MAG TPA: sulfatase-like hydrolase/transferase, partial [Naasia sp.]